MKKLLKIFLSVLLLCVIALLLKNEFARLLTKNSPYGIQTLISKTTSAENLFVGSSMFRQGIDIFALEEKSPGTSWILAYNGNQPVWEKIILESLLNNNVKIKTLFLDMYAYSVVVSPKVSDERLFLHTDLKTKKEFWNILKQTGNASLQELFQMFVTSNNEILWTWPLNKKLTDNRYLRGGNTAFSPGSTDSLIRSLPPVTIDDFSFRKEQKNALFEIFALCKKHNVNLVLIETPKYIEIATDSNYLQVMTEYIEFAKANRVEFLISESTANQMQQKDSSFNYIERMIPFNSDDPESFQDRIHLSSKGRKIYTEKILKFFK
jgi:hypothetical protein